MEFTDAMRVVGQAIEETGLEKNNRPRLLSDNRSCMFQMNLASFLMTKKWAMSGGTISSTNSKKN